MSRHLFRMLMAMVFIVSSMPLTAFADTGTPAAESPSGVEEQPAPEQPEPTATMAPTATSVPTEVPTEPAPTATTVPTIAANPTAPVEGETVEPTATSAPTVEPTQESAESPAGSVESTPPSNDAATQNPTVAPTAEPTTSPDKTSAKSAAPSSITTNALDTSLMISVEQCEDNTRAGTIDILSGVGMTTLSTAQHCKPFTAGATVILAHVDDAIPPVKTTTDGSGGANFYSVEPGTYTVTVTIGDVSKTSGQITIKTLNLASVQAFYFVAAESGPVDPGEGIGEVTVKRLVCIDGNRAGELDFFIDDASSPPMLAASEPRITGCVPAQPESTKFTLTETGGGTTVGPLTYDGIEAKFSNVPSGEYTLTDGTAGATSDAFVVAADQSVSVRVVSYVDEMPDIPLIVTIVARFCEDNTRAGATKFELLTYPISGPMAASASVPTCFERPADTELPANIEVSFRSVDDSQKTYVATFSSDGFGTLDLPAGTYTVTESINGTSVATSGPIDFTNPIFQSLEIVNYVEETGQADPDGDGTGSIIVYVMYCESDGYPEGTVTFSFREATMQSMAADTSLCEMTFTPGGIVTLYPVDPDTGDIDTDNGQVLTGVFAGRLNDIASATYVLGFTTPTTGEIVFSKPFPIMSGSSRTAEIHIYSEPIQFGTIQVYKDFCVDPAQVGTATFSVVGYPDYPGEVEPQSSSIQAKTSAVASTNCRYSNESDGSISWTLTNVDGGRTWTSQETEPKFNHIPNGTYTLTEEWNGLVITSQEFSFEPPVGSLDIIVKNYIAEADWSPEENPGAYDAFVFAFICSSPDHDGDAEFFVYGADTSASSAPDRDADNETAECRPANEIDGLSFEAVPQGSEGDPIPFTYSSDIGAYESDDVLAPGYYIITESSSGTTTDTVRIAGHTELEFHKYKPLPRANVTIKVSSLDPTIANALPADATWTVSRDGVEIASDTFATKDLQLPVMIPVTNPVPYGTYEITIDGTPGFLFYSGIRVVDEPTEAFEIVLIPIEDVQLTTVSLNATSADPSIANRLPDSATWTVTSVDNPVLALSGGFADDQRDLPVSFTLPTPLPDGEYIVEIDAEPAFTPYSQTFTLSEGANTIVPLGQQGFFALQQQDAGVTWNIMLQPAAQPATPTPVPTNPATPEPTTSATPTPTGVATPESTSTPTGTASPEPATPLPTNESETGTTEGAQVTGLPTTGQGASGSTSSLLLLTATSAAIAAIGGVMIRRKRA